MKSTKELAEEEVVYWRGVIFKLGDTDPTQLKLVQFEALKYAFQRVLELQYGLDNDKV